MKITLLVFLFLPAIVIAGEGYQAGYNWAIKSDIIHPDDCGGNSQSFIEGCREYAEERQLEICSEDSQSNDCERH